MQLELKIESTEEFLTLLEALRVTPVVTTLEEAKLQATVSEEIYLDFQESVDEALNQISTEVNDLKRETKVLRGALDETISNIRQVQTASRAVEKPRKEPMVRGIYCRFCGKELDTSKTQRIFCSQACAGRWTGQHKGEKATPRLTLKDERLGTTVVAGEGVRE